MRKEGSKASPIAEKIKEVLGMTMKGYAETRGLDYKNLCHLAAGTCGTSYGPAGIGKFGKIANQLKKDNVWVEPVK